MTLLALPTRWLGAKPRAQAVLATGLGLVLLVVAFSAWISTVEEVAQAGSCALDAATRACDGSFTREFGVGWSLAGPIFGIAGSFALAAGLACLLRPRGTLDPAGERILNDATRFVAFGALSTEGFQATRDRLHAQATRRDGPQVALGMLLACVLLALVALVLTLSSMDMLAWMQGAAASRAPRAAIVRNLGIAASLGTIALTIRCGVDARLLRRASNQEASRLQAMLRDLERDVLDEVRHSQAHAGSVPNLLQTPPASAIDPMTSRPAP